VLSWQGGQLEGTEVQVDVSSGIMDCVLFTFKKSSAHSLWVSVVWHLSLPIMNSFNKTEAAISQSRLRCLRAFAFLS